VEVARAKVVHAAAASTQEVVVARERVEASIKEAEVRATLAEREVREWVLKAEAESTTSLAIFHQEANESTRRVALLEGEITDTCWTRDMAKANFQGSSDRAANANQ
jgi:hypothetical protein